MLTKQQKTQQIKESKELIKGSKMLIFVDFTGTTVDEIKKLRRALLAIGSKLKVVKKKLLRVALSEDKIDFNPEQFESQVGTIFSSADISEIAGPIYKFSKEHPGFKLVGGLNVETKEEVPFETIQMIGSLPSREILLAQLLGALTAPIRGLMYILQERSKQT